MSSLLNAGVDSWIFKRGCHFRSEVYSMVESGPKEEVPTNLKRITAISVFFGEFNNSTVTFDIGSKQFRLKVYIVKCVIK